MNALICKQILALLQAETRDQCPFHWSYLVSVPLPLYLKMAVYQYFLSCLANFGGADTPGSGTEGTGKMGDLGANRVCLYAVSEGVVLSVTLRG